MSVRSVQEPKTHNDKMYWGVLEGPRDRRGPLMGPRSGWRPPMGPWDKKCNNFTNSDIRINCGLNSNIELIWKHSLRFCLFENRKGTKSYSLKDGSIEARSHTLSQDFSLWSYQNHSKRHRHGETLESKMLESTLQVGLQNCWVQGCMKPSQLQN